MSHYIITKDRFSGAHRWKVYRQINAEERCTIGHFPTRREAFQTARLLAGWRGTVSVER